MFCPAQDIYNLTPRKITTCRSNGCSTSEAGLANEGDSSCAEKPAHTVQAMTTPVVNPLGEEEVASQEFGSKLYK